MVQMRRLKDKGAGYDARAEQIFGVLLDAAFENGVRVVGNMGGANPEGAFELAMTLAREAGHSSKTIALVTGDDVLEAVNEVDPVLESTGERLSALEGDVVSANAYIGAEPIVEALDAGADLVIGGRVADPSLFLGPLRYEFEWREDDWGSLAAGQLVGHLLECGHHATGGNMADPPYRVIPGLTRLGYPMGEVERTGDWVMTKLADSGGVVDVLNCKAQLFHEIHDPSCYLTPDVTVDITDVTFEQRAPDRVFVTGARGLPRPEDLKVLVGVMEGFIAEGEMTFAGPGALDRARLAEELLTTRISEEGPDLDEVRFDFIGVNSAFGGDAVPALSDEPPEVRFRLAARTSDRAAAEWVDQECHSLYFGPASGGGMRRGVREVLGVHPTFLSRDRVNLQMHCERVRG
jgi:hypothetical protein